MSCKQKCFLSLGWCGLRSSPAHSPEVRTNGACMWEIVSLFHDLQVLPKDAKEITTWHDKDEAWNNVAKGVLEVVKQVRAERETAEKKKLVEIEQKEQELLAKIAAEKAALEQKEQERLAKITAENREKARLEQAALDKAEQERLAKIAEEQAEQKRIAKIAAGKQETELAEKRALEKAERERLAQIEREKQEDERKQQEVWDKQERDRLAKIADEKQETERLQRIEAEKKEQERLAKIAAEKQEQERIDRLAAEQKIYHQPTPSKSFSPATLIGGGAALVLMIVLGITQPWKTADTSPPKNNTAAIEKPITPPFQDPFEGQMLPIPAGTFMMGSKEESPIHKVSLSAFQMGKYEVTQKQWKAVMGNNPSSFSACEECPVEQVSWDDIQGFLKKLNEKTAKKYRLPTEAEWEYAAKGGQDFMYAGSNNLKEVAWFDENSNSKTNPVEQKKANGYGLYDMSGNAWEWCADEWHNSYKGAPTDGSAWIERKPDNTKNVGVSRVLRGGSWHSYAEACSVSYRYGYPQSFRFHYFGFRLVVLLS